MKLREIETKEVLEIIENGGIGYLWWKVDKGTIGNHLEYFMPRVNELKNTTWFVEEDASE